MLVGRSTERGLLTRALQSTEAELVAVYGRRRVGKTFLVRQHYGDAIRFELTGMHRVPLAIQLRNFATALSKTTRAREDSPPPHDWMDAFRQLAVAMSGITSEQPRVVFFDEMPWLASPRSGFLPAFEHFWNSWASRQERLVVVICGSAASWMLRHVVRARGGFHNRLTRRIRLLPFTLGEARDFLVSRGVDIGLYQTLELYLAMGGVPHYLKEVERGDSAATAIDRICFSNTGLLRDEFGLVLASLFAKSDHHEKIVRALASRRTGATRQEIAAATGLASGGTLSQTLEDLEASGFIMRTPRFGRRQRDAPYRLSDEYSLFYLRWIESHRSRAPHVWMTRRGSPAWRAWSGYAFESVCAKHISPLKRALGIEAVETTESTWSRRGEGENRGAQIDLLVDRRDATINLCEMEFSEGVFTIDKRYADDLRRKRQVFREATGTRKAVLLTMVTTYGVTENAYASELVARSVEMDALFG